MTDSDDGQRMYDLAARLYPICRSLAGDGVRETLSVISEYLPLDLHHLLTGTELFDWKVPQEWGIKEAYIKRVNGGKVVDFARHNLHVVNFSVPVCARMSFSDLKPHIHTLPDQPDLIPYRTCYHTEAWGFCMSHNDFLTMGDGFYEVVIDSERKNGLLTRGEYVIQGESTDTFILSAHLCHPSLANDNCSGLAVLVKVGEALKARKTRLTYRLLFGPATFGALAWLKCNEEHLFDVKYGLVISCVGDGGGPNYKRSRQGNADIDKIMDYVIEWSGMGNAMALDFWPYGYDERQFCSPGFDLPVGMLQRSLYGSFPEYHTSADNLEFIRPEHLEQSFQMIMQAINIAERNWVPTSTSPKGEPQLGKRDLYSSSSGGTNTSESVMAMLWALNLADGGYSILDMSRRAKLPFGVIADAADRLKSAGLLVE